MHRQTFTEKYQKRKRSNKNTKHIFQKYFLAHTFNSSWRLGRDSRIVDSLWRRVRLCLRNFKYVLNVEECVETEDRWWHWPWVPITLWAWTTESKEFTDTVSVLELKHEACHIHHSPFNMSRPQYKLKSFISGYTLYQIHCDDASIWTFGDALLSHYLWPLPTLFFPASLSLFFCFFFFVTLCCILDSVLGSEASWLLNLLLCSRIPSNFESGFLFIHFGGFYFILLLQPF